MTAIVERRPPRVERRIIAKGEERIAIDGELIGPPMTRTAARVVERWLLGGALDDSEGGGRSKLERTLTACDKAADLVTDLLKNGLR